MTDQQIYALATNVVLAIVRDLSGEVYKDLGGSLSVGWSTSSEVAAWAESSNSVEDPPNHRVVISYELVRQLYRDAEKYHDFAVGELNEERFQVGFAHFEIKPILPTHMARDDCVQNMFMAALTWVLFHELGHSVQEHGHIRRHFGAAQGVTRIKDCQSNWNEPLQGPAAVISQVTELAADVEATYLCVSELTRHFLKPVEANDKRSKLEFRNNLQLAVCGIASALYLFHGLRPTDPESTPVGSHPTPIRRLEVVLPNIYEKLDFGEAGERFHGLNRRHLVELCIGSAYSVGFFWLSRTKAPRIPPQFMPMGLLQDPYRKMYWKAIIEAWDEIEPEILQVRRFGSPLGMLSFSGAFRAQVFS